MTGTTHFLAGAAVGKITKNPILAVIFGFLIHFLMDMIPHWDFGYLFCKKWTCYLMAMSDPIVGIVFFIIVGIVLRFDKKTWALTFLGGLASLVPDASSVLIKTFQIEQLRWFLEVHTMVHTLHRFSGDVFEWKTAYFTTRQMIVGLAVQIPFILLSLIILMKNGKTKKQSKPK